MTSSARERDDTNLGDGIDVERKSVNDKLGELNVL